MELKIDIEDKKDLLLLIFSINNTQIMGRADITNNNTGREDIEAEYQSETALEYNRLQRIKVQLEDVLEGELK